MKSKMKKIIVAGVLVKEIIYPRIERRDNDKVRAAKRKVSTEAQRRMNLIYSWQLLELQLAANYFKGDLFFTPTYREEDLPKNEKEAQRCINTFLRRLRTERRKLGQELRYHYCTEHKHRHEDPLQDGRWHHHIVINATGDDFELIRKCWTWGDNIEIRPLRIDKENTYEALARYMCKEAPDKKVGKHCWHHSRNIRKPEVEVFRVDEDTTLQAPKGSMILEDGGFRELGFKYQYVKYMAPGWDKIPKRKAKRRRHR